jgi:hypothetical protein
MKCCASSCSGRSESSKVILLPQFEAVLHLAPALPLLQDARRVATVFEAARSSGFRSSLEQPPRS